MRNFTPEEKELIVNTPITLDCFDMQGFDEKMFAKYKEDGVKMTLLFYWQSVVNFFDLIRCKYLKTKDERYFTELVRLLPNSYKVVNLCAERKDICKAKHMVSETPHYGKESRAVPCYTMGSCNDCGLFFTDVREEK